MPNCKFYRENMVSRASRTRNDFGSICASFIVSQFFLDHEKKKTRDDDEGGGDEIERPFLDDGDESGAQLHKSPQ